MELVSARPETVAEPRDLQRPRQRERGSRRSTGKRAQRRWARDSVDVESCPVLEAPQRVAGVRPEDPVEHARRKAVPGELELEGGDVPALEPVLERPRAERVPSETAEGASGLRTWDAVDHDVRVPLEVAHGLR